VIGWRQALRGARRALGALGGGGAPRAFRRQLARTVGGTGDPRRGTAWLRELAAIQPRLRSGPLFGGTLAELTGGEAPAAGAALPVVRRGAMPGTDAGRRERSPRPSLRSRGPSRRGPESGNPPATGAAPAWPREVSPGPDGGRPPAAMRTSEAPAPRRALAALLGLAQRADRNLLERLSTAARALPAADLNQGGRPRPGPFPAPVPGRGGHPAPVPLAPLTPLAPPAPGAAAEARWRRDLSRRAQPVRRAGGTATTAAAPGPTRARAGGAEEAEEAEGAEGTNQGSAANPATDHAAAPWQTPLNGERAPREILDRFLSASVGAGAGGSRPVAMGSPARPESTTPEIHPTRRTPAPAPRPGAGPTRAARVDAAAPRSGSLPLAASSVADAARAPAADLAAATGPLLVPPPSLPPFLQINSATEVALRRPAGEGPSGPGIPPRVPAALPEDDLAVRIDRLLAEEARRHGIDV
jgi:hypothetical protein